jgi:Cu(I)/Ag(I) efflux system membrane fusion protein
MTKKRVFVGIFVVLVLAAGTAVAYRERCSLIGWYQVARYKVMASVKGTKSTSGAKSLYYCPMHPSFTSDRPGSCSICGMSLVKKEATVVPVAEQKSDKSGRRILYYRNPMNPQVTSPVPMKDEMGMDYVPVYEDQVTQAHPGVYISPEKQQLIGVKKGRVEMRRLASQIRTVGRVAYDPALFTAQQEYLQILKGRAVARKANLSEVNEQSESLLKVARYKLRLMGMSEAEIDTLEKRGTAETSLYLPTSEDKNVWVYVTIYEYEAGLVKEGMPVYIDTLAYPGEIFRGQIVSITPLLETATRTLKARALVENPEGKLKLEMFANVRMDFDLGAKLAVPEEAVMHAGTRNIVFVADPNGYFAPRNVVLGTKAQGYYEVRQGLAANEEVVTSGNFLVDSESKLNAVLNQMGEPNEQMGGHQHD